MYTHKQYSVPVSRSPLASPLCLFSLDFLGLSLLLCLRRALAPPDSSPLVTKSDPLGIKSSVCVCSTRISTSQGYRCCGCKNGRPKQGRWERAINIRVKCRLSGTSHQSTKGYVRLSLTAVMVLHALRGECGCLSSQTCRLPFSACNNTPCGVNCSSRQNNW